MSNFSASISAFAAKTGAKTEQAIRAAKIALFTGVIMDTRVLTGRARSNWQTTESSPAAGTLEAEGPAGINAALNSAQQAKGFTVSCLTNNLPYIKKLNDMDGMVERNITRIERTLQEAARG